ncbi:MAG: methionine adenosyltransferase [Proteobacteria bacterium]|nr:methionine adenosyltransferase [Pseudomonadota bacterium]
MAQSNYLFTSESVSEGHPDKVADQISDSVLDAFFEREPEARVAVETLVTTNLVVLAGEYRAAHVPDVEKIARETIRRIGYAGGDFDPDTVEIINRLHGQSPEIAQGVDAGDKKEEGAGDQGIMFGYATNETPDFMPAPIHYAHRMLEALAKRRHDGDPRLKPDAKSQLTLEYRDGKPFRVNTLLISHQHAADCSRDELTAIVRNTAEEVLPKGWFDADTRVLVNPTGSFVHGGPGADTGLTGRKIIVDTYGGMSRHGGGAFSGKDPTKVDRSAAYAARYLAKNIVAADLADCCEIQLCYAIGVAEPLAIYLDTFGTIKGNLTEDRIAAAIGKSMSLTPKGIRSHLGLNKPIYAKTASYGHFGRQPEGDYFSWERTDLADEIVKNL